MSRGTGGPRCAAWAVACVVAVAGCAAPRAPAPRFRHEATVAPDATREELLLLWGVPSRVLEGGRILTWRVRNGAAVDPRHAYGCPLLLPLDRRDVSLVVVFDAAGRVTRWARIGVDVPARAPDEPALATPAAPL